MSFNNVSDALALIKTNPLISGAAIVGLVVYSGIAVHILPSNLTWLLNNTLLKVAILIAVITLAKTQNILLSVLIAVAFALSMQVFYRLTVTRTTQALAQKPVRSKDPADGPDGVSAVGSVSKTEVTSQGTQHRVQLRGHQYAHVDDVHLIPGGQGEVLPQGSVVAPTSGISGYDGRDLATIGGTNSQL